MGTGPMKELDRGLDMMAVKGRSSQSAMACSPSRNFRYSTDVELGAPNSAPPSPLSLTSLSLTSLSSTPA